MSAFANLKVLFKPDTSKAFLADPFVQLDREHAISKLDLDRRAEADEQARGKRPDRQPRPPMRLFRVRHRRPSGVLPGRPVSGVETGCGLTTCSCERERRGRGSALLQCPAGIHRT